MKLKLIRTLGTDTETMGYLEIDGKFFCYTLEDAVRDKKIKSETCIPFGSYQVQCTMSPRFQRIMPLVYNNPHTLNVHSENGDIWSGIRLHGGNTHLDTDGCPLLAYKQYINKPTQFIKNNKSYTINNWIQGTAEKDLTDLLGHKIHELEIVHIDTLKKETLYKLRNPYMKDDMVGAIQRSLQAHGIVVDIDNVFGPKTHQAIIEFQSRYRLKTVDGIVGFETAAKLGI